MRLMNGKLFAGITFLILVILLIKYRKQIKRFVGDNVYLYCWAIMLVSNLGFSSTIQYTTRALSMLITWIVIIVKSRGKLKIKKNNEPWLLFMLYLIVCFISCAYSISRLQSFAKVTELFTDVVLLTQLLGVGDRDMAARKAFDVTAVVCFVLLTISLVGFFVYPKYFANTGLQASKTILGIRLGAGFLGANKASALSVFGIIWLLFLNYKRSFWTY